MTLEEFRSAAMMRKKSKGHRPKRYSREQKAFAIEYARSEIAAGTQKMAILEALGITDRTLTTWLGDGGSNKKGFRRVALKNGGTFVGSIQVVTPGGYRVEGLTIESAAALLRSLR